MFSSLIKKSFLYGKFIWLDGDATFYQKVTFDGKPTTTLNTSSFIHLNTEEIKNRQVIAASWCGGPIPKKFEGKYRNVGEVIEMYNALAAAFEAGDKDVIPGIFVAGGMYENNNTGDKYFALECPSKNQSPYVYIGEPWKPSLTVYRVQDDKKLVRVKEPTEMNGVYGPEKFLMPAEMIHSIQLALTEGNVYKMC